VTWLFTKDSLEKQLVEIYEIENLKERDLKSEKLVPWLDELSSTLSVSLRSEDSKRGWQLENY